MCKAKEILGTVLGGTAGSVLAIQLSEKIPTVTIYAPQLSSGQFSLPAEYELLAKGAIGIGFLLAGAYEGYKASQS